MNSDQIDLDQLKGKWKQVKWSATGELTDDCPNALDGEHDQVIGKTHEIAQDPAQKQVAEGSSDVSNESDVTEILRPT